MTQNPPPTHAAADALAERAEQLLTDLDDGWPAEERLAVLDDALPLLRAAVDLAPDHPDGGLWCRATGWAHAVRGDLSGDPADRDAAVDWTRRARPAGHPDVDPDELARDLAHMLVLRNRARFAADDPAGVGALLADLAADGPPSDDGTPGWAAFAVASGLTHVDAHDLGLGPEHLGLAQSLLSDSLHRTPDDAAMLVDGLLALGRTSWLLDLPDPGLAAVDRVRDLDPDLDPADLDVLAAELHQLRGDLDAVVALLRNAHAARPDDRTLTCWLAERLTVRGERDADLDDLDAAVDLIAHPHGGPLDDPEDRAATWYVLGGAHVARWRHTGADDDRDRAESCLAEVVDLDPSDVGILLEAHGLRLEALHDRLRRAPDDAVLARSERALVDIETALARALDDLDGAPPEEARQIRADRATAALAAAALDTSLAAVNGVRVERLRRLVDIAETHPEPPPDWTTRTTTLRALLATYDGVVSGADSGAARELLTRAALESGLPGVGDALGPLLGQAAYLEGLREGDLTRMVAAGRLMGADNPDQATTAALIRFAALLHGDPDERELLARMDDVIDHSTRAGSTGDQIGELFRRFRALVVPDPAAIGRPWPAREGEAGSVVDDVLAGLGPLLDQMATVRRLPDLAARRPLLHELASDTDRLPAGPVRSAGLVVLATSWGEQARATPADGESLDEAVRWTAAALADLPGPEHPLWGSTAQAAAEARRLRDRLGDRAESRRLALASLRARTWTVLLQAGAEEARVMAREAAGQALRVARWCAADRGQAGATEDLVAALESGRGLVLHAALTTRGITGRLADAGHADLAREWDDAGGDDLLGTRVPALQGSGLRGDLRRRVLDAVNGEQSELLSPPGPAQLRAALRAQGTDALVYLVAGDATAPGLAVLVSAEAAIEVLELPRLRGGPGSPLARYVSAYGTWRSAEPDERRQALQEWRTAVAELTRWAWTAAADDVLAAAAATAADPAAPRLALVPVGELALVPWHAAGPGAPGAVLAALAIVSVTPSARMLCQVLARPRITAGDTLIVGDPTGDLPAARTEAQALRRSFYPAATYVGRGGRGVVTAGRGVSGDVLERLGTPHGVVHLACHAHAEPDDPARSGLRLADGDLAVADLLGHRPTQRLPLDTVLLAACSTTVSGSEYDEAFSLATAFLAAGARTVFGSLWEVPDGATSELMFMVHHGLRVDGLPPAEALHRAQRWMLDPDRVRPPGMPPEPAAPGTRSGEPAAPPDDPLVWAGFVHLGA